VDDRGSIPSAGSPARPHHLGARIWFAAGLSAIVESLNALMCEQRAASYGEGVILRWMRVVADHPWRSGIALALLIVAATWPDRDASSGSGSAPW
jgi:hypothetical protein